jgi:hypothetical protein
MADVAGVLVYFSEQLTVFFCKMHIHIVCSIEIILSILCKMYTIVHGATVISMYTVLRCHRSPLTDSFLHDGVREYAADF